MSELREDLGASEEAPLEHDPSYTSSRILAHLDRELFEADAGPVDPDDGLVLPGVRRRARRGRGDRDRGGEADRRRDRAGRHPDRPSPAGRGRAASRRRPRGIRRAERTRGAGGARSDRRGSFVDSPLPGGVGRHAPGPAGHLRSDPTVEPGIADSVERRIRRGQARTVDEAIEGWATPPRHPPGSARRPARPRAWGRWHAQRARSRRAPARRPHLPSERPRDTTGTPAVALELRWRRRGGAAGRAGGGRRASRLRGARPRCRRSGDRERHGACLARRNRRAGPHRRPVPGARGAVPVPLLRLSPGGRVSGPQRR